ncbi:DUF6457 domain-containing protein [Amycolatopsis magusensis]|uniref:DUF6457 domain-containing protein n=1 Tax=Amycolatopsis magusensis TaxID=882444 RepID=UPI0024A90F68|nr:DUF6457 domain-containing protein [Amycolatopsis magusensis]MDI5979789.1 DUF6457 domain-containing protein [Amycolatopsis magusensis]
MNMLSEWTAAVCAELGLDAGDCERVVVLKVARESATAVARPAAPITAFLLGVAVGRGVPAGEAVARVHRLADHWPRIDWRD